MTTLVEPARVADSTSQYTSVRRRRAWVPYVVALLVIVGRLPFLKLPAAPDEGGFLAVAAQWHPGGTSLYGSYWVDRPPLLITLFQLASALGGLPALRLLGCLAAATTVLAVASSARVVGGERAAGWSAVVAAALLVSPLTGALEVNGELMAAPFIATGIACAIRSVTPARGSALWPAAATGACAVAAVLVKQNMLDVAVFAVVTWFVAYRAGGLSGRRLARAVLAASAGGTVSLAIVAAWTVAHGTSLAGVFYAMYPFRLQAGRVIAASTSQAAQGRFEVLAQSWALSAVPLLVLAFAWLALRRRVRGPVVWGLLVTLAFSIASILMGGSYWFHYLVEMVPAVAIAAGVLAATTSRLARLTATLPVVVAATVAWAAVAAMALQANDASIGADIRSVARPGDTVVSAFGNADIVQSSGLTSPYPYLWSLPARTLDPGMRRLRATLAGPTAPTWFVVRGPTTMARLTAAHIRPLLGRDYRPVGELCGRTVYLKKGVVRPSVSRADRCPTESSMTSIRHGVAWALDGTSP